MLYPNVETFIGCDSSYRAASIVLYGAPYDSTTSYRPGARFGPAAIRHESYGLETYSPYQNADLRDDYLGAKLSHACVLRRCHELVGDGRIHQFCIRSGDRTEFEFAAAHTEMHKFDFTGLAQLTEQLCASKVPVYLTIDLDCLDPSCFPGTGTPEAGGVSFLQLLEAIRTVTKANIVGADLNELAPTLDTTGVSTATACKVLRELLIALDKGWPGFQV